MLSQKKGTWSMNHGSYGYEIPKSQVGSPGPWWYSMAPKAGKPVASIASLASRELKIRTLPFGQVIPIFETKKF